MMKFGSFGLGIFLVVTSQSSLARAAVTVYECTVDKGPSSNILVREKIEVPSNGAKFARQFEADSETSVFVEYSGKGLDKVALYLTRKTAESFIINSESIGLADGAKLQVYGPHQGDWRRRLWCELK